MKLYYGVTMKFLNFVASSYRFGLHNSIVQLQNSKFNFEQVEATSSIKVKNTSISDSNSLVSYIDALSLATTVDSKFDSFRKLNAIRQVIDNVTLAQGKSYLDYILKKTDITLKLKNALFKIDSVGSPIKYKYKNLGECSPLSLRYLNTYLDLEQLFGSLSKFKIIEIGGGFGGQAFVINQLESISEYQLFDLPLALKLQKKYLDKLITLENFKFSEYPGYKVKDVDLIISNYAFSELNRELQKKYLNDVILKASRGFIIWNDLGEKILGSHSLADLVRLIPNSEILPDNPNFKSSNAIIVWGHNKIKNSIKLNF